MTALASTLLRRCRWAIAIFIGGLVLSGLTAFPLATEMNWLAQWISPGGIFHAFAPLGLQHWILQVRDGLAETYARHPWIAYGTDWLAFGHLMIALFFIPAWRHPVRHASVLRIGIVCCALVLPLAFIAGPIRGIPFYWRVIDCSFGVFGTVPLVYALRCIRQIEGERGDNAASRPQEWNAESSMR